MYGQKNPKQNERRWWKRHSGWTPLKYLRITDMFAQWASKSVVAIVTSQLPTFFMVTTNKCHVMWCFVFLPRLQYDVYVNCVLPSGPTIDFRDMTARSTIGFRWSVACIEKKKAVRKGWSASWAETSRTPALEVIIVVIIISLLRYKYADGRSLWAVNLCHIVFPWFLGSQKDNPCDRPCEHVCLDLILTRKWGLYLNVNRQS